MPNANRRLLECNSVAKSIICQKSTKQPSASSSSSSSESDNKLKKKPTKSDAVRKLNFLLDQMVSDNKAEQTFIDLAQPLNKREQGRQEKQEARSQSVGTCQVCSSLFDCHLIFIPQKIKLLMPFKKWQVHLAKTPNKLNRNCYRNYSTPLKLPRKLQQAVSGNRGCVLRSLYLRALFQ